MTAAEKVAFCALVRVEGWVDPPRQAVEAAIPFAGAIGATVDEVLRIVRTKVRVQMIEGLAGYLEGTGPVDGGDPIHRLGYTLARHLFDGTAGPAWNRGSAIDDIADGWVNGDPDVCGSFYARGR